MFALRYTATLIVIAALVLGVFVWKTTGTQGRFDFKLGLDLSGGTQLVYSADTSKLTTAQLPDSLAALQAVIERRVNAFGVGEPVVELQQGGALGGGEHRISVELPGVTDVNAAIARIGQTPLLEFKLIKAGSEGSTTDATGNLNPAAFEDTGLTGAYIQSSQIEFGNGSALAAQQPAVRVDFNAQGKQLFATITDKNVGRELAIFLDGKLLSAPVIQEKIDDGTAIISGSFTAQEAKDLATNLNLGALPVPIHLESSQTIGATLGADALHAGLVAGIVGFLALVVFLIFWYRLPGLVAVVSLTMYMVMMLAAFKIVGVVLTAAGLAGFILSVGLAVDANVLIAERMKEEINDGKDIPNAIREGFARAWTAIRDSNIAHLIAGVILFWMGTSIIKGFALVFILGVVISLFSAVTISRTFLLALGVQGKGRLSRFLMRSGFSK
jgi:preprotein translocase subunit SecD